jgi:hypothetical protein
VPLDMSKGVVKAQLSVAVLGSTARLPRGVEDRPGIVAANRFPVKHGRPRTLCQPRKGCGTRPRQAVDNN